MSELGSHSLRFALAIAALALGAGVAAGWARRPEWTRVAERGLVALFACASLAMLCLFQAFASFDFSLAYVVQNSARSMPLHYRLAALWGGQAGSLLLWLWMLCAYGAACVWVHRDSNRALMPWVVAVLSANALFFLVLVNFVTPP